MNTNTHLYWKPEYNIGINVVDEQHQEIVEVLNRLYAAIEGSERPKGFLKTLIYDLNKYVVKHFAAEEKLMIESDYPDYKIHSQQHRLFSDAVKKFQQHYETEIIKTEVLANFVKGWFMEHTQYTDRHFAKHYIQHQKSINSK